MNTISFFELLGVADAPDPTGAAAALWPGQLIQGSTGQRQHLDPNEAKTIVGELNTALSFRKVRPGADPDRVGLTAEVLVGTAPPTTPFVIAAMPDVEFHLLPTPEPARVTVTSSDIGVELLIEALPVEIHLPIGLLQPIDPDAPATPPLIDSFAAGQHDTITIELNAQQPSVIKVHVKIRMTEEGRFVIEPAVPLSVGPCRFSGLPCRAVHDLNLFPSPLLGIGPGDERHYGDQALEWARHPLLREGESEFGVITVRTLDLDDTRSPLDSLHEEANPDNTGAKRFEWVLEDLALPIGTDPVPVPSHFLIGLRRELGPGDDPLGAYNLGGLAIPLKGAARILHFQYLVIEQLLLRSVPDPDVVASDGDRQFAFVKMALVDDPSGKGNGATIDLTDEWTVLAGWRNQPGLDLFQLFSASFRLLGARLGLSIQRMSKGRKFTDCAVLVGDIEITLSSKDKPGQPKPGVCSLEGESDEPKGVVIHDFGWKLGDFSTGSFWQTGGAKLKAFDVIRLEIDEFGLITEPSGALYFGFSGSIPLPCGCDAGKPVSSAETAGSTGKVENGVGFRFYKLRGKIAGDDAAPMFLIDGIGLSIRYGTIGISGFGLVSEYVLDGHRYKEAGLSIEVRFQVSTTEILLGGLFFHGSVRGPVHNFKYYMVGLHVSPIPLGPITLSGVQLLFAWNMTPNLGTADAGSASSMQLFEWYKANRDAVALPSNRNLGAGGWKPEDETYTIIAAAQVLIAARAVTVSAFFAYLHTASGNGLLAGLEIFLLASKKPIGFAVLEIDGDRWSVSAGLSVGMANVIGRPIPFLSDVPLLTGTFYHTNKPATTAIGQFQDPNTWLALHIGKKFDLLKLELFAGLCLQIVDLPEGPRVFGLRVSITGGSRLFKVGGIDFYVTLQLQAGVWRTESKVSGFIVFFEGGLNIDVFYVFNFGASVHVECDYLGPAPAYRRFTCEVKVHTPWWLPDVTFRWRLKLGDPALEQMQVLSTPAIEAGAKQISVTEATPLPALSPVVGTEIDADAVYSINDLASADGTIPPGLVAQIQPIAIDSSLSLHFKSSINDRLVFGQPTTPAIGADSSEEVSTNYELVEFGIRRRPLAGGGFTVLIDAAQSRLESLNGLPPDVVHQRMQQIVPFRWDADFQREGKPDARRLLINTDTPFLFTILNFEGDETLVQNTPGWPCCGSHPKLTWHFLDFHATPIGTRVPRKQLFSASQSTLQWVNPLTPITGPGQVAGGVPVVARVNADSPPEGIFARLTFSEIAQIVQIHVAWKPFHLNRNLVLRAFRGLKLLEQRQLPLKLVAPTPIVFSDPAGITDITIGLDGAPVNAPETDFGWMEFVDMQFRSVSEVEDDVLSGRCDTGQDNWAKPGGRFAWLPHHEYELSFKTRVRVKHQTSGDLVRETPQRLLFQTKGLPGLNLAERIGEEFSPYVESTYPAPGRPLYRSEPVLLALNERSDIFRIPDPPPLNAPSERRQQIDWVMVVSSIGGGGEATRLSRADADWIVAHRGTVPPPPSGPRPIDVGSVTKILLRNAVSQDPLWQRFEAVLASASSCNRQPSKPPSRTISHQPYDPAKPDATPALWPAQLLLRAATQIRLGPFIDRRPFEPGDETALLVTGVNQWTVRGGAIGPKADTGTVTSFATFGDAAWKTFHLAAAVNPQGGAAGIALGAMRWIIDGPTRRLRAFNNQTELTAIDLPAGLEAPFTLELNAYEDAWKAAVGAAELTTPRGPDDTGRLAMAVNGNGAFTALTVEALDLYRFEFLTSRYPDFAAHIASWPGRLQSLPEVAPATTTPVALVASTPIADLMRPGSDPAARQRAFDLWIAALGIPVHTDLDHLEISRRQGLILIESPEPLPITEDVSLQLSTGGIPVPVIILTDGSENRAILVTQKPDFTPGDYRIDWTLARTRFRSAAPDGDSRLTATAVTQFTL